MRNLSSTGPARENFPLAALRQLRTRILQENRSLHDAFALLEKDYTIDKLMIKPELHVALRHVTGEGADEFFVFVEEVYPSENISLAALFRELVVSVQPEGLLWELRCRLVNFGLWPHEIAEAQDMVKRFLRFKVGFKTHSSSPSATDDPTGSDHERDKHAIRSPLPSPLSRQPSSGGKVSTRVAGAAAKAEEALMLEYADWLRFCGILGLSVFEAKLLFEKLRDDSKKPLISLRFMFELVEGTVAPNASLMSFAERALIRHGSLREAFQTVCFTLDRQMKLSEFHKLTEELGFGARSTDKMWSVLVLGETSTEREANASRLAEDDFVVKLLRWTPNVAFDALKAQLLELYGGLSEGKRALRRHGLPGGAVLSPRKFKRVLFAAGILHSDTDVIVNKVLLARTRDGAAPREAAHEVTLDEVFERLRGTAPVPLLGKGTDHAQELVTAETAPLWQQLHNIERDLALGCPAHATEAAPGPSPQHAVEGDDLPRQLAHIDGGDRVSLLPGEEDAMRLKLSLPLEHVAH